MNASPAATSPRPAAPRAAAGDDCTPGPVAHAMGHEASARVAATLKALADPLRLRMLSLIAASPAGEACVCDLAAVADVTQPTVSHHLKVLKDVGVLTAERRGTWVFYSVTPPAGRAVTALLEGFAPAAVGAAEPRPALPALTDADPLLARVAAELSPRYPDLDRELVAHVVRESYASLARGAGVRTHLVVTAERFARQRLDDVAHAAAPTTDRRPRVLFVCVANAGRSQLAAALLRRYAGDAVIVRSAGSAPADDVHATVRAVLADLARPGTAPDDDAYPKPLTDDAVRAADVVITMGCGDTCPILPGKRYEDWVVGDPALASPAGVLAIRDDLDARVRALLADLVPGYSAP